MYLSIHAPDQLIFSGTVDSVSLPGSKGAFQVLKDHAPLIATLKKGAIVYQADAQEHALPIYQGIVEILDNQITVLVEINS